MLTAACSSLPASIVLFWNVYMDGYSIVAAFFLVKTFGLIFVPIPFFAFLFLRSDTGALGGVLFFLEA